jgi:hypothetical protein
VDIQRNPSTDEIRRALETIGLVAIGLPIEASAIAVTETTVPHNLGRVPNGRLITYQSAESTVWDSTAADEDNFYLTASAAVTVNLWVF